MYAKSNMETYITMYKIANGNLLYGSGNSNRGSVLTQRVGMGREFQKGGIYVYLWLIQIANIRWIIEKARVPEKHLFLLS